MTEPGAFRGVSHALCATAWDLIQPAVERAWDAGVTVRRAGCVVVAPPRLGPIAADAELPEPVFVGFLPDCPEPDLYLEHGLAKARVSWISGLGSRSVQQDAPHLYLPGWNKWGGSVVRSGLVCAFSGVEPVLDEMIAGWMADAVLGLCRHEMTRPGGVMDAPYSYLGGDGARA